MSPQPNNSFKKIASGAILYVLTALAKAIVRKYHPRVVAITGSVGKTTAKEAVAHLLQQDFAVEYTRKNMNTEWGVAATVVEPGFQASETVDGRARIGWDKMFWLIWRGVQRLVGQASYPRVLVLELAADKPGDIHFFNGWLRYDVAVITNIGQVHLEFYEDQNQLTAEKLAITKALKEDGLVVVDGDGALTQDFIRTTGLRKTTFGWELTNDYAAKVIQADGKRTRADIHCGGSEFEVVLPFGRQLVLAALVAMAVGREFGLSCQRSMARLQSMAPLSGRFEIDHLKRGIVLINDAYNANPDSMKLALASLQDIAKGRRVAVLGGMKELGQVRYQAHQDIGKLAARQTDLLILIGEDGGLMAQSARDGGAEVKHLETVDVDEIFELLRDNDTVLIKASRAVGLDVLAEALKRRLK